MKSTEQAALEAPVLLVTVIAMEMNMTVATAMDMERVADGVGRNMRIVHMIGHLVVLEEGTETFSLPILSIIFVFKMKLLAAFTL